jgi:hypothetical protein
LHPAVCRRCAFSGLLGLTHLAPPGMFPESYRLFGFGGPTRTIRREFTATRLGDIFGTRCCRGALLAGRTADLDRPSLSAAGDLVFIVYSAAVSASTVEANVNGTLT